MLCELFFSFGPCFKLVKRIKHSFEAEMKIDVEGSILWNNMSETLSCQTRCSSLNRQVPGYSLVNKANLMKTYNMCKDLDQHSECGFPINVDYSFQQKQWLGKRHYEC